MQLGETLYSAICVLDLWICLYLCIWGSTAASTPNQRTVGMFTPSSLFFLGGISPSPHGRFLGLCGFFFSAKGTSTKCETGLTKRTWNWPKTFDYFLASEKEQNFLILRIVIFSLFPEHMLSWAAVCPGSLLLLSEHSKCVLSPFHQRTQKYFIRFFFPSQKWKLSNLLRQFFH